MKYFFDFDGTIIDVWKRFYKVFSDLNDLKTLSLAEYIILKRKYKTDDAVAKILNVSLKEDYYKLKLQLLEQDEYLQFDQLLIDIKLLNSFIKCNDVYIITKRNIRENFFKEIERLGIKIKKSKLIVLGSKEISKNEWFLKNQNEKFVLIGDGREEYNSRFNTNIVLYMVNTGFLDINELEDNVNKIENLEVFIKNTEV